MMERKCSEIRIMHNRHSCAKPGMVSYTSLSLSLFAFRGVTRGYLLLHFNFLLLIVGFRIVPNLIVFVSQA